MALEISLRDFRTASLEPGDYENDERLDRSVLGVALGVVGGGMAFLLGMVFLVFPEWIRPIAFGTVLSDPRVHAVLLRPGAAADKEWGQETPFHQAQGRNLLIDRSVRLQGTAQPPSANQTVSVNPPPRGQASTQAPPASGGRAFGRVAENPPGRPAVQPPASAQPVPVPKTATRNQQGRRSAAAGHGNDKKLA